MNYSNAFEVIKESRGDMVAALACAAGALHLTLIPTMEELTTPGAFTTKLKTLWKDCFFEIEEALVEEAIKAWIAFCEYDVYQSLNGLGGCEAKPFDVIYNDPKTYEGWDFT